ncbi:MAG: hypothetical protein H9872_05080 [Candidatus Cellulosilyticum pullistercoris]|uniref:Uncharacterized protein n=1 Tax=Candidatus Cellulosilyticum pullistercoris TaxID=2838521 RepID=A0A9E2KBN0_9FIRM|nr:hypothetical protein [Candidatus Cellulosilyticum pullistercoris]
MKKNKHSKQIQRKKKKLNMYEWVQKNKKVFSGIICIILVIGLLAGLLQI